MNKSKKSTSATKVKRSAVGSPPRKMAKQDSDSPSLLEKYGFETPKEDDKAAVFEQMYLSKSQQAVIVHLCNSCLSKAGKCERKIREKGLPCLLLPMCRSCVFTNRRGAQTVFFNIVLKNMHDKEAENEESKTGDEDEVESDQGEE